MIATSVSAALARWFRGPRALLGAVALVTMTALTAVLLVSAYWDPAGNSSNLSAAIVNEDVPVTANGRTINAGDEVVADIIAGDTLQWRETTFDQAQKGLDSGTYALVLRIPESFSASVTSLDSGNPVQATINAYTNDASNYLAGVLAQAAIRDIETALSADLSLNFINEVYDALPQAREQGESAVAEASVLSEGVSTAAGQASEVATSTAGVADAVGQVATATANAATTARALTDTTATASTTAAEMATSITSLNSGAKAVDTSLAALEADLKARNLADLAAKTAAIRTTLATSVTKPASDLATKSTAATTATGKLSADTSTLNTSLTQASEQLTGLTTSSRASADAAAALAGSSNTTLVPQSVELLDGLANAASKVPPVSDAQREAFTTVLAQPIDIVPERQNDVRYLGEGFAPLFLPTSLFLGAMVIFLLNSALNRRQLDVGLPAWLAVGSRWLPSMVWLLGQVVVLALAVAVLGVQVAAWPILLVILLLSGAAFVSVLQLLKATLGGGGHLVAMALLMVQVVASGAIFPVPTLGGFFQFLHPLLPMSYAVDGVRRAIAGGPLTPFVVIDVIVLATVALAALGLSVYAATRKRTVSQASLQPAIALR